MNKFINYVTKFINTTHPYIYTFLQNVAVIILVGFFTNHFQFTLLTSSRFDIKKVAFQNIHAKLRRVNTYVNKILCYMNTECNIQGISARFRVTTANNVQVHIIKQCSNCN